ncbi:E3 ubiquitin-protein ligase UBR1 isoform X2 [Callorhinchus milii]|uniref:E3 ubiquitin-protein ligase n=2 Tax=Callorhinchus milii TaxID=7868 RepID=A0A4W3K190_CALMI|nr:E3 ubiquitin-protein ligase UBR1 isoform X2 [Callorhinchus milii]|eukprot:gi/632951659/ref/XP_007891421.1/ PREDICTED: E3 ubiquitin-protein ligase UBR1 isoform X2 [Callorhinchus milii]
MADEGPREAVGGGGGGPDPQQVVRSWQEAVDLRSVVYRHLSEYVPSIRCVVSVAKCPEEEQGHQMLLRTMEWFLFGEAPEDGFAKLQENKSSSQLCGRVFKGGETTYSCRDCAIDPTCVLCMDCFQSSVHRNHRYKMNCSYGGGLCDCGDVEAWKTGPFCTKHEPGLSEDIVNHASQIPAGVAERAQHLFDIIFRYLVDMLIWTENKGLPLELQPREKTDSYFCMLFNDEDHSVDHVIHSLQKSLGCSTKEAENYTWMVDKEGRRVIKHGTLQSCQETKQEVFNNTNSVFQSPLRVEILHSTIVSHQTFACRLLSWLNHMIGYSAGLRQIFCDLALQQVPASDQPCFISRLMLSDVKLWKGARKAFHELIVCSLLMEAEYKRLFAIEFIKHYKQLQLESVEDDQDRNISVTALSVQIFTVPTLARHLIEEHDALKIITETIIELWSEHMENGKLNFQTQSQHKYFRNEVVLNDLKYVLISKPPLWTDRRRDRFLEGFNIFLRLLKSIQGMEPVCRQFGQHVEIEPDWEPAFTVQMFLKFILLMMQEWCASDEQVLLRAYKECHSVLSQCSNELIHCNTKKQSATLNLCGHSVSCVVSREPISIHLPLSRLLAGLHAHLSRSGAIDKLEQYVPSLKFEVEKLMEYPLRCLVLVSQVSADMWRRNGFSLVNQVFCYRSAKWREEMFDKDIVMLQIGASLMDPNHFLMLVLNKFELFEDFTKHSIPKSKDEIKQNVSLLEEFLHLIIMVVGERHVPGIGRVTKEEVTMREVIHLLSIESMAHSSLVKALPENESNETGLEKVIHEVATFKKPGLSGHGVYELKPECLKEFNLYFYHYDKSQQTKAEDEQKKRKKQANSNEALPPPVPPQFVPAFAKITSILNCDVFMLILRTVCQQAVSSKGQLWSEAMIQKALHLICMALQEEHRQLKEAAAEEEVSFDAYLKATRIGSSAVNAQSVLSLVEHLKRVPQLNAHKDMILWTLQMFDAVKKLREKSSPFSAARAEIQRTDEAVQDKDKAERKRKAEAAKLHRQKIMAQMSAMQKNFIESNKHLYEKATEVLGHGAGATEEDSSTTAVEDSGVALGPKQGAVAAEKIILTCILCQEEQEVRVDGMAMVLTACVQRSTALTQNTCQVVRNTGENCDPLFMHPDLGCGTHAGSCGHVMHASCWQKYFEAVQNSTRHRLHADLSFHLDNVEYLCPLCKSLCNAVIPVLPLQAHSLNSKDVETVEQLLTLPKWLENVLARITGLNISHTQDESNQMQENPASWKNPVEFRSILSFGVQPPLKFSDSIVKMLMLFAMAVHREGLKVSTNEADVRVPVMVWGACAFTIQSIENNLSEESKPLFGSLPDRQGFSLKALLQFAASQRVVTSPRVIQKHLRRLLSVFMLDTKVEDTQSILTIDFFHHLVSSVLAFPSLYWEETVELQPSDISSTFNNLYLFHLITMAHIVQILFTSTSDFPMEQDGEESEEAQSAVKLYEKLRKYTSGALESKPHGWYLWNCVKCGITPFLRSSALFFNYLLGVPPSKDLWKDALEGQFEALCYYFALPSNLFKLFEEYEDTMSPLLQRWCSDSSVQSFLRGERTAIRFPRERKQLMELPEDYSCLLNQDSRYRCPHSTDDETRNAVLCMFCGTMICSQSQCCQQQVDGKKLGGCSAHAVKCGSGLGIFLRIKECQVLLLAGKNRGCFVPAPYLDDYGETDQLLKRGNPLHLCPDRYRKLQQMWRQHRILEEIARNQDANHMAFAVDWHEF